MLRSPAKCRWYGHLTLNNVDDGDQVLLHKQSNTLSRSRQPWNRWTYSPSTSDRCICYYGLKGRQSSSACARPWSQFSMTLPWMHQLCLQSAAQSLTVSTKALQNAVRACAGDQWLSDAGGLVWAALGHSMRMPSMRRAIRGQPATPIAAGICWTALPSTRICAQPALG